MDIIGSCQIPGWRSKDIVVAGDYAFISGCDVNLQIVDVSDPHNPAFISSYDTSSCSEAIAVSGHYVYMTLNGPGLLIIDISDILNPVAVSAFETPLPHFAHDIFVNKSLAYLADCTGNLKIIDVSDPSRPDQIGAYDSLICHEANGIFVVNDYAYLTEWIGGLFILDVSDPSYPSLIGQYQTNSLTHGVEVAGNYAYLKEDSNDLTILDVTEPQNPIFIAEYNLHKYFYSTDLYYLDGYIYLAHSGLYVIDVSNPIEPFLAASSDDLDVIAVFATDQYIYAASYGNLNIMALALTDIKRGISDFADHFSLCGNFPNPFNSSTSISFNLNEPGHVNLSIYNIQGQRVAELLNGIQQAGEHSIIWDASDYPSGVYFARLEAGGSSRTAKMVLLK